MRCEVGYDCREITLDDLNLLNPKSERIFAYACLKAGCRLIAQIPVLGSKIDFYVINPKLPHNRDTRYPTGKLVEVTLLPREYVEHPELIENPTKKQSLQIMSKHHQIDHMNQSGQRWTILYENEINNIKRHHSIPKRRRLSSEQIQPLKENNSTLNGHTINTHGSDSSPDY